MYSYVYPILIYYLLVRLGKILNVYILYVCYYIYGANIIK